jgi:hypothetical protein
MTLSAVRILLRFSAGALCRNDKSVVAQFGFELCGDPREIPRFA